MNYFSNFLKLGKSSVFNRHLGTTTPLWKGHAKWQNIKHIKAAKDQQRSLMVSKQLRAIRIAAQGRNKNLLCVINIE